MCGTLLFRRKPRVRSFLEYTVRQTLDEQHAKLKEYSIAVEVFKRPEDFDPRLDSIVRVEARRLRATVERYYETEGRDDELVIRYRRGTYVPVFETRQEQRTALDSITGFGGEMLVGLLTDAGDYGELAGRKSASLTILRQPLAADALAMLRAKNGRVVLLKPASPEEVESLIGEPDGV
jgi:hypothetical protein